MSRLRPAVLYNSGHIARSSLWKGARAQSVSKQAATLSYWKYYYVTLWPNYFICLLKFKLCLLHVLVLLSGGKCCSIIPYLKIIELITTMLCHLSVNLSTLCETRPPRLLRFQFKFLQLEAAVHNFAIWTFPNTD